VKTAVLGVSPIDLARYGAVSAPVAIQMATDVLKAACADIAVAVTGFAGPGGGTESCPVGTVYISVATKNKTIVRKMQFGHGKGDEREYIRTLTVMKALDLVRRMLLDDPNLNPEWVD
jgi:nicotinamide-nucleotide amidase